MTLTVRLDTTLEAALERYCLERGVTKSLVVQESLATYLVDKLPAAPVADAAGEGAPEPKVSANYKAFAEAGLIGCIAVGRTADKAGVRAQVEERFAQLRARRPAP